MCMLIFYKQILLNFLFLIWFMAGGLMDNPSLSDNHLIVVNFHFSVFDVNPLMI